MGFNSMQSDSIQTFNRLLDMINSGLFRQTGANSQGVSQMRATANYRDDYDYEAGANSLSAAKNDKDAQYLEGMAAKVEASKQQVREAEKITERFANEHAAAKTSADAALKPFFEKAFANPERAEAQLQRVMQSENPRELLNAMASAQFGKKDHDAKMEFAKELHDIDVDLEARGVDTRDGGQRIFAREVMKRHPEMFGDLAGNKGLFGNDQDRKAALAAIDEFEPNSDEILDLDEKLALATQNAELSEAQLGRIRQNAKNLEDRADLSRMAQMEAELAAAIEEEPEVQVAAAAATAELEDSGQHEFAFDEAEQEIAQEVEEPELVAQSVEVDVDDVYDLGEEEDVVILGAEGDDADPSNELDDELSISASPEDRIGGVAEAEPKPSLMSQVAGGFASLRSRAQKFAKDMGESVSRKYQEVKNYSYSLREEVEVEQERVEPTIDMNDEVQVQTQDRVSEMYEMFSDPDVSVASMRARLDHEAEAYKTQKGVTFVDIEGPDGTKQSVPKEMAPLYDEVKEMEAFENREPVTAASQRSQLLAAEKEYYAENKRGKFSEVEIDGEKHMVRQETKSHMEELNDRVAEEQASGVPQPLEVDVYDLTPKGQAEKAEKQAQDKAKAEQEAEKQKQMYARMARRRRRRGRGGAEPSQSVPNPLITRFR